MIQLALSIQWVVPGFLIAVNLAAFTAHAVDKRAAIRDRRRIPEARLHLLELLGGWPGALLAMLLFRHKIRKPSYLLVFGLIAAAWIAGVAWYARDFVLGN